MPDGDTTVLDLRERVRSFVRARDWEQFHNPKDLASAIAIEAAELMEIFLWKTPQETDEAGNTEDVRRLAEAELADILILSLSLANRLQVDLADTVIAKLVSNEAKYPAELARGSARKYTHYADDVVQ